MGTPDLRVERATDDAAWDRFVAEQPSSTFAHQSAWAGILRKVLGHVSENLVARDESGIRAVLPLTRVKTPLGHYLISVPFVNDGGPIGDDTAVRALVLRAQQLAQTTGASLLELRTRVPLHGGLSTSFRKVSVHLPLPDTHEALWKDTFKAKLRSQIRRPSKEGMTAHSDAGGVGAFYEVFSRNMRDLGTPVLPRRFFEALSKEFGDRVFYVRVENPAGKAVAASCCMQWRDEVEVTWASSLRDYNHLSPNMLLYATMMEESITRGARDFNFGRSSPGAPTHKFKLQWGGTDAPLPWAFWSRDGSESAPTGQSTAYRAAIAMWQRLPMPVANAIGPIVSRCFP